MRSNATQRSLAGLVYWLALVGIAAALGTIASYDSASFYAALERPGWAPPSSVFGPVWTALYVMMAFAAWLAWRERGFAGARTALTLFVVQLAANALWSWLFFRWKLGGAAFADIVVLALLLVATIVAFWRVRPLAGALLVPYLAWVVYAAALNYSVWQRNPGMLG